jgi:hypothetical protein
MSIPNFDLVWEKKKEFVDRSGAFELRPHPKTLTLKTKP